MVDIEYLSNIQFFNSLEDNILFELSQIVKLKKFVFGDILFYEKDNQNEIFYLVEGAIKFYKVDRFDNEIFLYKIISNSIVFDISKMCDDHIMSCYANAEFLEDSKVLIFDSIKFRKLMKTNHSFMQIVLKESFRMIQQLQCIISRDVVFDGTAKVSHMLVNDLKNFNILKKHETAYMLHIQPETLSRILKKLTRNGIIEIEKNCVKILNLDELREIYE
ncbi:MAG TPA: Crp/Fnr family transcriptional regulator [Sulfurospirillum arcachonense]|nr:Crp/Fnr family transcriptional regulator [Sulfurospirillum arcachonense]HIP44874.1 Crp/Fnr family transcriptional regulator [Sulfurospirillum arcachonense]